MDKYLQILGHNPTTGALLVPAPIVDRPPTNKPPAPGGNKSFSSNKLKHLNQKEKKVPGATILPAARDKGCIVVPSRISGIVADHTKNRGTCAPLQTPPPHSCGLKIFQSVHPPVSEILIVEGVPTKGGLLFERLQHLNSLCLQGEDDVVPMFLPHKICERFFS